MCFIRKFLSTTMLTNIIHFSKILIIWNSVTSCYTIHSFVSSSISSILLIINFISPKPISFISATIIFNSPNQALLIWIQIICCLPSSISSILSIISFILPKSISFISATIIFNSPNQALLIWIELEDV